MPDFQNFSKAVSRRGEPDRVPPLEYHVDHSVRARFLAHPVETADDRAEFFLKAGSASTASVPAL